MHIDLDIVVYAVIALVVFGRLWFVLGTRNDSDPQRPNPFTPPPPADAALAPPGAAAPAARAFPPLPTASLAGGLAQIATLDPSFQEKQFLQQARDMFTVVVTAYAAGNLDKIGDMLSHDLRAHFQAAIDRRRNEGQSVDNRIAAITDAEVIAARADGHRAFITVQFVSNQENILRDNKGAAIGGTPGKLEQVTDVWGFARDTAHAEAGWQIVETRG